MKHTFTTIDSIARYIIWTFIGGEFIGGELIANGMCAHARKHIFIFICTRPIINLQENTNLILWNFSIYTICTSINLLRVSIIVFDSRLRWTIFKWKFFLWFRLNTWHSSLLNYSRLKSSVLSVKVLNFNR